MRCKKNLRVHPAGFTLLELLLYIGLLAIILSASSFYLRSVLQTRARNQSVAEVDSQGYFAMQTIMQQVRNATSVTSPAPGASAPSLTLAMSSPADSPTIFSVADGVLKMQQGEDADVDLTSAKVVVQDFVVRNAGTAGSADAVRVEFILARSGDSNRWELTYEKFFEGGASLRR